MLEYAALVVSSRALPAGLILVFQHPVRWFPFLLEDKFPFVGHYLYKK